MSDTTYNGWTNYKTWLVNLWIDNELPYVGESIANACGDMFGSWEEKSDVDWRLGDFIKEKIEELIEEQGIEVGLIADLVRSALAQVNWREIAGHYCDSAIAAREQDAPQ